MAEPPIGISLVSKKIDGDRLVLEISIPSGAFDTLDTTPTTSQRRCVTCNGILTGMRADAKFCSANCRQQGWLAKKDRTF